MKSVKALLSSITATLLLITSSGLNPINPIAERRNIGQLTSGEMCYLAKSSIVSTSLL